MLTKNSGTESVMESVDTNASTNLYTTHKKENVYKDDEEFNEFGEKLPKGLILWSCTFALALANFIAALDIMIVTTIMDEVSKVFNSYSKVGWVIAGYSLPNAVLALLWGRLADDVFGFKCAMLLSILIFEIGSLICALANSMNMLIGGRVIAGIGGSGIQSLSFVIGSTLVSMRGRGFIMAFMAASFGIASVVGPFIGGAFTTHVTWRWCFWVNIPIGGLALAIFVWFYNPTGKKNILQELNDVKEFFKDIKKITLHKFITDLLFKFDIVEFIFSSAGLVCLLLGLTFGGSDYSWDSYTVVIFLTFGSVLIIVALLYDFIIFPRFNIVKANFTKYQPLISWNNMKKPGIFTASMVMLFYSISFMSQNAYYVQFFQLVYNETSWRASIHLITLMVTTVITSVLCGGMVRKLGYVKPILIFSMVCGVVGSGILLLLDNHSTSAMHIGLMILPGIAFGCSIQCTMMAAQLDLDKSSPTFRTDFISITTFNSFLKNCGPAVGGVISNTIFSGVLSKKICHSELGETVSTVNDFLSNRTSKFDGATSESGDMISDSVKAVFYMALGWCILAFLFSLFVSNKRIISGDKGNKTNSINKEAEEV
ncbi:azole resistance protein 1 [Monosporozyma unispora]|nr:hypothetical protein C6P44_001774 [Kazachstania unispora]